MSCIFTLAGPLCLSVAIFLTREPPAANLYVFGLWFLFGGICYAVAYLARKLKDARG